MSSSSSSHSSLEHSPDRRYAHEHPVYTYEDYETFCLLKGNGSTGRLLRNRYIHLLTCEKQPETTNSFFRLLPDSECKCLLYTQTRFCFHILTSNGQAIFPKELRQNGPAFQEVNAKLGLLPNWSQGVRQVVEQLHYYSTNSAAIPYPNYITCTNCFLVQRQKLHDGHQRVVPRRHKCDVGKKDRYGKDTTMRYITTFKTKDQKIIEMDITCIPLHQWDFHHLIPGIAVVYEQCHRLGLQTSLLQMCFQDIAFIELFAMLERTQNIQKLGVYSMYLYLQHRLIPHLKQLRSDNIKNKPCPIYTMVVTDDATASKDLLGYDRDAVTADMCRAVPTDQKEAVVWFNKYKNAENGLLQNFITDGLNSTQYCENFLTFLMIMNKYRPVHEGVQGFLKRGLGDSVQDSRTFTIHCGSDKRLRIFGNIFDIVPSGIFCPTEDILYKMLMLCSGHPYKSWLLKEPICLAEIVRSLQKTDKS